MTSEPRPEVDAVRILIPADWQGTVDVLFDGDRVMSFDPRRQAASGGARKVTWPAVLRRFLRGTTELTLVTHVDATVLFKREIRFDDSPNRVTVKDAEGHPLALDKWDNLVRTFENKDPEYGAALLEDLTKLLRTLNDEVRVPGFIAYGSLLGAVREGGFIAHDTDADIAYLSHFHTPVDVARESFRVERELRRHGWGTHRISAGFVQVWDGHRHQSQHIDIFTSYLIDEWWAMDRWVRKQLPAEALVPLGEVEFEGRMFPAPADPHSVLAATYGPSWRVPDPSFKFSHPRSTIERARGYLGYHRWINGGRPTSLRDDPRAEGPSAFAEWVGDRLDGHDHLLDVGCRGGVDALRLAERCAGVVGFDHMEDGIASAVALARTTEGRVSFHRWSVYDLRRMVTGGAELRARADRPAMYVRRILEHLRPQGTENIWLMARTGLRGGGRMFLELGPEGDLSTVQAAVARHGGTVELVEPVDDPEQRSTGCYRIVARW